MSDEFDARVEAFKRRFAEFQRQVMDDITPQAQHNRGIRKGQTHALTFGPLNEVFPYHAIHILPPKIADTPTLECACGCGMKLFVYYRVLGLIEVPREHEEEGNEE